MPVELVHHHIHNYDISLKFHVSSKPVILKLQENTQFKTRIPTYIICENGSIVEDIQSNDLQVSNRQNTNKLFVARLT